jgi:hypothetical protein
MDSGSKKRERESERERERERERVREFKRIINDENYILRPTPIHK